MKEVVETCAQDFGIVNTFSSTESPYKLDEARKVQ